MEVSLENEVNIEIMHTVRGDVLFLAFLYHLPSIVEKLQKKKKEKRFSGVPS
jgi:hypothetical protein